MALKTYVLLEHTKSTANVYIRTNPNERVRLDKRPNDAAYLQMTFTNKDGIQKTIRLKLNSNTIYQDEQIKQGILANEKYTDAEREIVKIKNGVLVTTVPIAQKFFDETPQNEAVWNSGIVCTEIQRPLFKEYNQTTEIISENQMFKKRLAAANKIASLDLEQAKELMIRLNGSHFKTPDTIEECQNQLVDFLDEANEAALDDIIRDEISNEEEIAVLVSKAIEDGVISFEKVENHVVRVTKDDRMIPLREIPSSYGQAERERIFVKFLTTKDGALILNDLRTEIDKPKPSASVSADDEISSEKKSRGRGSGKKIKQ